MVSPSRFGLSSAVLAFRVLSGTTQASAHLANITIDDTNSTFWTWAGSWHAVTPSTPCTNCFAQPDPSKAYDSTWHDGSLRSGSFSFQGTAVYIYGIDVFDPANISFSLNDPALTSFHYYAGQDYQYNSLFFQAAGLTSDVQHTVTWVLETSAAGGGAGLFDYAVVTVDEPDPTTSASASNTSSTSASTSSTASSSMLSTSSSSPSTPVSPPHRNNKTGAIVGAVVGVVGGLALLGFIYFFLRRRQTSKMMTDVGSEKYRQPCRPHGIVPAGYSVEPFPTSLPQANASAIPAPSSVSSGNPPSTPNIPTSSAYSSSKAEPVVLSWDPQRTGGGSRSRGDLDIEERLRHLEDLAASSQPPAYH